MIGRERGSSRPNALIHFELISYNDGDEEKGLRRQNISTEGRCSLSLFECRDVRTPLPLPSLSSPFRMVPRVTSNGEPCGANPPPASCQPSGGCIAGDRKKSSAWLRSAQVSAFKSGAGKTQSPASFFKPPPPPRDKPKKTKKRKIAGEGGDADGQATKKKKHGGKLGNPPPRTVGYDEMRLEKNRVGYVVGEAVEAKHKTNGWFNAEIIGVQDDKYLVQWQDGDETDKVYAYPTFYTIHTAQFTLWSNRNPTPYTLLPTPDTLS